MDHAKRAALKAAGFRIGDAEDFLRAMEVEDLRAIQEAVAELQAGDEGTPLGEAFASIRGRDINQANNPDDYGLEP